MSIKPINFGSPMVRAILEGRKMQTRRVLNDGQVYEDISSEAAEDFELRGWHIFRREDALCAARTKCTSGDLLWVREQTYRAIHLPMAASRITLEVTGVRVEHLQNISEADAIAEGVERDSDGWTDYLAPAVQCCGNARDSFATLWVSIYGEDAWAANPWVAVYEFTPIMKNIGAVLAERGVLS